MPSNKLSEKRSRELYEISSAEYKEKWRRGQKKNFHITQTEKAPWESWMVLPDQAFRDGFDLAFVDGRILSHEEGFCAFTDFLHRIGESRLVFSTAAIGNRPCKHYCFPVDIGWLGFQDKGNGSPTWWGSTYYHYLYGSTRNWGFFFSEAFHVYTVGVGDADKMEALRDVFGFEGRNIAEIEQINPDSALETMQPEAQSFRKLATQLLK